MADPAFVSRMIDGIIAREGDYSAHPSDRGGPTRYGITLAVARREGYYGDMQSLPRTLAIKIYRERYYLQPRFDLITLRSEVIAEEVMDSGVNFGPTVPSVWLQRWLNGLNRKGVDYPDLVVDGAIGQKTAAALSSFLTKRGADGEQVLLAALNCSQGHRYLELAEGRPDNEDFLYGWVRTRVLSGD